MLMLIDTREPEPEPERGRAMALYLDNPELRPLPWFAACALLLVVATVMSGWPCLIPTFLAFGAFLGGIASLYQGNDGLSRYRQ